MGPRSGSRRAAAVNRRPDRTANGGQLTRHGPAWTRINWPMPASAGDGFLARHGAQNPQDMDTNSKDAGGERIFHPPA
jgi:hypothetical protein